ncbi:MAG: nuclear transport factor 2 family protein [Marinifilaceae bacterium]|jgi:hypothetical protein
MKKVVLISVFILMNVSTLLAQKDVEAEAIKKAIVEAYVDGIFNIGDSEAIKKGWHSHCDIVIYNRRADSIKKLPIQYWVDYFNDKPGPLRKETRYEFTDIHISGNAAVAIVEIYRHERHIYTDFMSLYKFKEGWKVATKIFYTHPKV